MSTVIIQPTRSALRPNADWRKRAGFRRGSGGGTAPGSPTGYWKVDSWTTTLNDSIGAENLNVSGTPVSVSGIIGNAATLNGTNRFSSASAYFNLGDTDFTYRVWFRQAAINNSIFFDHKNTGQGYRIQSDATVGQGMAVFVAGPVTGDTVLYSTVIPVNNAWNMVVFYHDSVNNLIGISANNGNFVTAAFSGGVGSGANLEVGLSGTTDVDEIGLWKNKVFSQAEVAYEWNSGAGRTYP